ncbi:DUF2845 domain-containing protein [Salinicola halophyticus]|uniref:DUF2845 domain-containing protein n=1 Tax=Salinicola halophyticus TaxID=1808881 RepID=UPI001CB6E92F|nr:DUF2845 domain-containing protein [Salinicola halophyticus]
MDLPWTRAKLGLWLTASVLIGMTGSAHAMRCDNGLTADGDSPEQVLSKCGTPASRVIELPQKRGGHVVEGAVTVERWVYGPRSGARYHLRFVAGKLVDEAVEIVP